jgi:hypothetical protein
MNSKIKRDSKDPTPTADNSQREGGGNDVAAAGEKHGQAKAERIGGDQRFTLRAGGEKQPTRMAGDGNTPVSGEDHGQGKGEHVTDRGGENTEGMLANSPGR